MTRFKDFPPGWDHIKIPVSSKAAALAGIAMYTPSSRRGELAQKAAWAAVSLGGPRVMPGRTVTWQLPGPPQWRTQLLEALHDIAGPVDVWCGYERREGRHGLLLLLLANGTPVGFVKAIERDEAAADDEGPLQRERRALELIAPNGVESFTAPRPLGAGTVGGWDFLVLEPLPPRLHRMIENPPIDMILAEVRAGLAGLPKPDGTPDHWVPAHGDFTPWNLRQVEDGPRVLIDWEEAAWAPPGADETLYLASAAAVGRPVAGREIAPGEAAEYWWRRIQDRVAERRAAGHRLGDLDFGLLRALDPGASEGAAP